MAGLGDRTRDALERWFTRSTTPGQPAWSERLSEFGAGLIDKGSRKLLDAVEGPILDATKGPLQEFKTNPDIPAPVREMVSKATDGTGFWQVVAVILLIPLILLPMISSAFQPVGNLIRYGQERLVRSWRFDPLSWIEMYRRFPEDAARYDTDLMDQGFTDDRIQALERITRFYPAPADLVRWQAREVFEPGMVEKYGLDDEVGGITRDAFYKAGMDDEQIVNYWRAHWEHASWLQVVEMLRRGLITEDDVRDWFRLVEIPPFWRDLLIGISWEIPTRVDVRRFWEYGTIDETRLREIYSAQGYHGKDLDDYVLWTKVYTAFPDLMTRYKNGWLSLDDVRAELVRAGMTAAKAEELIQTKVKAEESAATSAERTRTRTDILKGVKQGVITRDEGVELLQDLNYSEDEARFILDVNIPVDEEDDTVSLRQLTKSDIQKALKTELITEDQARERLLELRYSASDAELLLSIFRAANKPPEDEDTRELTKADIVKGVKKGVLTQEEAYLLLQGLGYSAEDAQFILDVETEESPFSPRSYQEFKDRTDLWRKTVGAVRAPSDDELSAAGNALLEIKREVKNLEEAIAEEERGLIDTPEIPESATERLTGMRIALNRALAEQQRLQLEFDRLTTLRKWAAQ